MMHSGRESGVQSAMEDSVGVDVGRASTSSDPSSRIDIAGHLQSVEIHQPLNPSVLDSCHRSKRWKELRVMMAMRKKAAMAASVNSSSKSPIKTLPPASFVVYENQCVVDITSPASAVTVSAAAPLIAPVLKRRCSLTMPYPALYGSWQAQTLSIAKASISVTTPAVVGTADKSDKVRNVEAGVAPSQKFIKPPLLRRWSTQQMDVQQSKPKQQIRPLSPCLIGRPIQHHTIAESENETNVDSDVSNSGRCPIFSLSQDPILSPCSPLSVPLLTGDPQDHVTTEGGIKGPDSDCMSNGQDSVVKKHNCDPVTSSSLTCSLVNECNNDGSAPLLPMCPSMPTMTDADTDSYSDHPHLITCTLQRLPLKDFGAEIRPAVDITQFLLQQSVLLLDVVENSPEDLVQVLLRNMVPNVASEAKSILFTHDSGKCHSFQIDIGTCPVTFKFITNVILLRKLERLAH